MKAKLYALSGFDISHIRANLSEKAVANTINHLLTTEVVDVDISVSLTGRLKFSVRIPNRDGDGKQQWVHLAPSFFEWVGSPDTKVEDYAYRHPNTRGHH